MSDDLYLRMRHVGRWRIWVRLSPLGGDGDVGQNDGAVFLQYVPVLELVLLRWLCRTEVAVTVLRKRKEFIRLRSVSLGLMVKFVCQIQRSLISWWM